MAPEAMQAIPLIVVDWLELELIRYAVQTGGAAPTMG